MQLNISLATLFCLAALFWAAGPQAHTLYAKPAAGPQGYPAEGEVAVRLLNGTFWKNESNLELRWMGDYAVAGPNGVLDNARVRLELSGPRSRLLFQPDREGTYAVGAATRTRMARLAGDKFNQYLRNEGLTDALQARQALAEQNVASAEKYTKFAKAIVQVGGNAGAGFDTVLGHPVEFVPLQNPAAVQAGGNFRVQLLIGGAPAANRLVYVNSEHNEVVPGGETHAYFSQRSSDDGVIEFAVSESGRWYIKYIDIQRTGDQEYWYSPLLVWLGAEVPRIPYESNWATLTFTIQ